MADLQQILVSTILATRDFCGNEREACAQVFADLGRPFDRAAYHAARGAANSRWDADRRAAGVPEKYL